VVRIYFEEKNYDNKIEELDTAISTDDVWQKCCSYYIEIFKK